MTYPREWLPEEWRAADEGLRLRRGYRRTDFQMIITSDYGGFAGGMVPEMCCPPVKGLSPEEEIPKDYYLRPTRLRRSSADRHTCSSGQHALTGVEIASTVCLPTSGALVGADGFLRLGGFLPEEIAQKDHHLRPRRLRRSSASAPRSLLRRTFAHRS